MSRYDFVSRTKKWKLLILLGDLCSKQSITFERFQQKVAIWKLSGKFTANICRWRTPGRFCIQNKYKVRICSIDSFALLLSHTWLITFPPWRFDMFLRVFFLVRFVLSSSRRPKHERRTESFISSSDKLLDRYLLFWYQSNMENKAPLPNRWPFILFMLDQQWVFCLYRPHD